MIVRCIANRLSAIQEKKASENLRANVHLDEVDLTVGKEYPVFGVLFRDGFPWLLICESPEDEYPKPHFGQFFEWVDARVPPGWSLNIAQSNVGNVALLPEPWAKDPSFLEKLVDEEPGAAAYFEELKRELAEWHGSRK